ncbi:hypothetical protein N7490_010992 [Penicillium lividum]|nr:hypothetical protein N7490_010992 [Penicillium lividum]
MDDAFNDSSMSADQYRLQTTPGSTGTMARPPAISHRGGTVTGMRNFSQEIPRQSTEDPRPLSSSQSDNDVQRSELTEEDRDILISEDYAHVSRPSKETYESVYALYAEVRQFSPETSLPSLPSLDILHACTQLFFEYFHPSFPILHQATFRARTSSWLLYLIVAALGSQYSRLSTRAKIFSDLVKIIRVSLLQKLNNALTMQNDLELAQATLLFHFALLFGGNREGMMHLQYQRNVLVTMCRPLLVPGILFAKCWIASNATVLTEDWSRWVATESWKRIIYFTWYLPTIIAVSDLHGSDPQECPGVLSLLETDVIDHECISRLSDPALWISVVSIYVADRQASQQQSLQLLSGTHNISKHRNMDSTEKIQAAGREEDTVDAILGRCQQIITERRQDSPMCLIVTKFSLILRLLRFIKYRLLYLSSGWMAQNEEGRAARQHIAELLRENPRQARQGLLHAAQLFRVIRSQRQFDPFDSFFLLIAILYIWNYTKYMISHSPSYGGGEAIFRIDQNTDADLQEKWLAGTFEKRKQIHIGGIGVLNGHNSMSRIFKEAMRILDHDKAWSRQANAIKWSLHQIMRGIAPSFADMEIATNETVT